MTCEPFYKKGKLPALSRINPGVRPIRTYILFLILLPGCSQEGVVPARGYVKHEGRAVSSGQLTFLPVGTGQKARSLIAEDGEFLLRTGAVEGVWPGSYQVMLSRTLADEQQDRQVKQSELDIRDASVMYVSPSNQPITISEVGDENLSIDVRPEEGWTREVSE